MVPHGGGAHDDFHFGTPTIESAEGQEVPVDVKLEGW